MNKSILSTVILCLLAACPVALRAQQRYVVGILPVYDESAEELTEYLPNGLAMLLFKHLRDSPTVEPMLLSAGGLYDPNSTDWNREFGNKAHVDALIITRLYKTTRVNDRKRKLKYSFQVMNVANGQIGPELTNDQEEVVTSSLISSIDSKAGTSMGTYISSQSSGFWRSPEDFEKQPVGKAAAHLADWTISQLPQVLVAQAVKQTGVAPPSTPTSCPVSFKIRFVAKHSIAKGYTMFANDQDETSAVKDGLASFPITNGLVAIRVEIPDPPYGVPTQKLYQSSTSVMCDGVVRTLNFDVGPAGEALLHWE